MLQIFEENGVKILKVYFCPHSPEENCSCRKPNTGMIQQSLNDFDIDLTNSWLIGDKTSDIETAMNANIPNRILISNTKSNLEIAHTVNNILETLNIIKQ